MKHARCLLVAGCFAALLRSLPAAAQDEPQVGPMAAGGHVVATGQLIHPAGESLEIAGRPVDLVLSSDEKTLFVKDDRGLVVIDAVDWTIKQELHFDKDCGGGSMCGIVALKDGRVLLTTTSVYLAEAKPDADGKYKWARKIPLFMSPTKNNPFGCGIAVAKDEKEAYVCLSRNNTLGVVDLEAGKLVAEIPVGIGPYALIADSEKNTAYVTNLGGDQSKSEDRTSTSAGTAVAVDERGIAAHGTLSIVDLTERREKESLAIGQLPTSLGWGIDGLVVANSNSDVLSVVNTEPNGERRTEWSVRPNARLPFGCMPNGVAQRGGHLYVDAAPNTRVFVSLAGLNAISVFEPVDFNYYKLKKTVLPKPMIGLIPTGWYPGNLVFTEKYIFVVNIKGVGARDKRKDHDGWNSHWHRGTISRIPIPDEAKLKEYTERVLADAHVPQILKSIERAEAAKDTPAVPVPAKPGLPSVFEHVVYVIKENRTYDQVFGDIERGNHDAHLCTFGREVTPNQHALADEFALLDNYYCNGVLSADGHSWATEGNVTPYLERAFGGFKRSYTFGDDPLTYSSSGFIWDHILAAGYSFRNFGEFDEAVVEPHGSYADILKDYNEKGGKFSFKKRIGVDRVRNFTAPESVGWNLSVSDQIRANAFLKELAEWEKSGQMPNFITLYLPNDHTNGSSPGSPTPRSYVADNDLAVGRVVEAISKSKFWGSTCLFIIEDDPQNGFDHVDGHRSTCLVISPYTKRGAVVSHFYNQTSVVHTIEQIFGCTPANQMYAQAPLMSECFTDKANLKPFEHVKNNFPLGEPNPPKAAMTPAQRDLAELCEAMDFSKPDAIDDDTLNRVLWSAAKGDQLAYPMWYAGAHGRGLKMLGLKLAAGGDIKDDDD